MAEPIKMLDIKKYVESSDPHSIFNIKDYFNNLYSTVGGLKGLDKLRKQQPDYAEQQKIANDYLDDRENGGGILFSYEPPQAMTAESLQKLNPYNNVPIHQVMPEESYEGAHYSTKTNDIDMQYVPKTPQYLPILHHELAHAAQEDLRKQGINKDNYGTDTFNYLRDPFEIEAEIHSARALYGKPIITNEDADKFDEFIKKLPDNITNINQMLPVDKKTRNALYRTIVSKQQRREDNNG